MSSTKKLDLGLQTAYDELFMNEQGRAENRLAKIYDIPISEIDDFPDHPYQVRMDEDMTQLVESVKERGIITPVTLRKKEDGSYVKNLASLYKDFEDQNKAMKDANAALASEVQRLESTKKGYERSIDQRMKPISIKAQ